MHEQCNPKTLRLQIWFTVTLFHNSCRWALQICAYVFFHVCTKWRSVVLVKRLRRCPGSLWGERSASLSERCLTISCWCLLLFRLTKLSIWLQRGVIRLPSLFQGVPGGRDLCKEPLYTRSIGHVLISTARRIQSMSRIPPRVSSKDVSSLFRNVLGRCKKMIWNRSRYCWCRTLIFERPTTFGY